MSMKAVDVVSNRICPSVFTFCLRYVASTSNWLLYDSVTCLICTVFYLQVSMCNVCVSLLCSVKNLTGGFQNVARVGLILYLENWPKCDGLCERITEWNFRGTLLDLSEMYGRFGG
jgi:hypothetical protein